MASTKKKQAKKGTKSVKKSPVKKTATKKKTVKKSAKKTASKKIAKKKSVAVKKTPAKKTARKSTLKPAKPARPASPPVVTPKEEQTVLSPEIPSGLVSHEDPIRAVDQKAFNKFTAKSDPQQHLRLSTKPKGSIKPTGKKPLWNK